MMKFLIFAIGLVLGSCIGAVVISLCVIAKQSDKDIEHMK